MYTFARPILSSFVYTFDIYGGFFSCKMYWNKWGSAQSFIWSSYAGLKKNENAILKYYRYFVHRIWAHNGRRSNTMDTAAKQKLPSIFFNARTMCFHRDKRVKRGNCRHFASYLGGNPKQTTKLRYCMLGIFRILLINSYHIICIFASTQLPLWHCIQTDTR